jgi:hypothetical protein
MMLFATYGQIASGGLMTLPPMSEPGDDTGDLSANRKIPDARNGCGS